MEVRTPREGKKLPATKSGTQRAVARDLYENKGYSQRRVADATGVSIGTIRNWSKKDGWVKGVEDDAVTVAESFAPEQVVELPPGSPAALSVAADDRVAELQRRLEEAQQRIDDMAESASTFKTIDLYDTPEQVEDFFGADRINDMVVSEFGQMNLARAKRGLPYVDPEKVAPETYRQVKQRILQEFVDRRTKWVDPNFSLRSVKMWNPAGFMAQIPIEDHFNNEKGVRGNAVMHYRNKGFKLISPYLCQCHNCYAPAAQENGALTKGGYCSDKHWRIDPAYPGRRGPDQGPLATSAAVGY